MGLVPEADQSRALFNTICNFFRIISYLSSFSTPALAAAQVGQEVVHPGDGLGDILHRGGIAGPDEALAPGAEGGTGDHRYPLLPQEALTELVGGQAGGTDIREDVESALGLKAAQTDAAQILHQIAAAAVC